MDSIYDVVIAGYGPTGAVLAKLLGKGGLRVLVVDQAPDIFDKPRGIGMDHEALRILQSCEIAHELLPHVRVYQGTYWHAHDGTILREFKPSPPPYPLGWPHNFTFLQPQFESMLRASVARESSVNVRLNTQLIDFIQTEQKVTITLKDLEADNAYQVTARYLVGSDGASSTVRAGLNIQLEDLELDEWWVVVDCLRIGDADFGDRNIQYCHPDRPGTYVVGPDRLRRWEFRILPHEDPDEFRNPERVLQLLAKHVNTQDLELWRSAVYRFHALVAERWHSGRVFLAGDAAHQTPPHLGQGLVSGLRDAMNLAWRFLHVAAGSTDRIFEDYYAERAPHFRSLVTTAKEFGHLIGTLDPDEAKIRDHKLRDAFLQRTEPETRQNHIPALSAGFLDNAQSDTPLRPAGELFVQPTVVNNGSEHLIDDGRQPRFQIYTLGLAPQRWLDHEQASMWRAIGGERIVVGECTTAESRLVAQDIECILEKGRLVHNWMATHACQAVVVRPDRYVYGVANSAADLTRLVGDVYNHLVSHPSGTATHLKFATEKETVTHETS